MRVRFPVSPACERSWSLCGTYLGRHGPYPLRFRCPFGNDAATGWDKSGHISSTSNEVVLFFDNLFPIGIGRFIYPWQPHDDPAKYLQRFENPTVGILGLRDPIGLIREAIPPAFRSHVTEILPRVNEGGAFVRICLGEGITVDQLQDTISRSLSDSSLKPWFSPFRSIKAELVRGIPWLEDLRRFPTRRLQIEFVPTEPGGGEPAELSQEDIFGLFRRYGRLADISSQPSESKVSPRFALLDFTLVRDAAVARSCLHGLRISESQGGGPNGTRLRLSYVVRSKSHPIWGWLASHPRVVIPVLAALLAAVTVAIFDPIRQFFIRAHVQGYLHFRNIRLVRWVRDRLGRGQLAASAVNQENDSFSLKAASVHRHDVAERLRAWTVEGCDSFIVVQGPRGSGKRELVLSEALRGRADVLLFDCKAVVDGRGESGLIRNLAAAVGYRPVFSWANNLSSLVDLAIQGTTGVKAGFSETLDSQVAKILQTTTLAFKNVALSHRSRADADADLTTDAYLDAHPERRPVLVIDNFMHRQTDQTLIYDKVAEWASGLVQSNIAHVIFLTDDAAFSKPLSRVMPDRPLSHISLGDLSPDVARKYVLARLSEEGAKPARRRGLHLPFAAQETTASSSSPARTVVSSNGPATSPPSATPVAIASADLPELDDCLHVIGGRLEELEALALRLKNGELPREATNGIIAQAAGEIVRMFLLGGSIDSARRNWSPQQAWHLIRSLASSAGGNSTWPYGSVTLSPTFASSIHSPAADADAALASLAEADLITISSHRGRPHAVRPGKPAYAAAFAALVADDALAARMDLAVLDELSALQRRAIDSAETELALLASAKLDPYQRYHVAGRASYLLAKVESAQSSIIDMDAKASALKKTLLKEDVDSPPK